MDTVYKTPTMAKNYQKTEYNQSFLTQHQKENQKQKTPTTKENSYMMNTMTVTYAQKIKYQNTQQQIEKDIENTKSIKNNAKNAQISKDAHRVKTIKK